MKMVISGTGITDILAENRDERSAVDMGPCVRDNATAPWVPNAHVFITVAVSGTVTALKLRARRIDCGSMPPANPGNRGPTEMSGHLLQ